MLGKKKSVCISTYQLSPHYYYQAIPLQIPLKFVINAAAV
jgi:hypothetical protein